MLSVQYMCWEVSKIDLHILTLHHLPRYANIRLPQVGRHPSTQACHYYEASKRTPRIAKYNIIWLRLRKKHSRYSLLNASLTPPIPRTHSSFNPNVPYHLCRSIQHIAITPFTTESFLYKLSFALIASSSPVNERVYLDLPVRDLGASGDGDDIRLY